MRQRGERNLDIVIGGYLMIAFTFVAFAYSVS